MKIFSGFQRLMKMSVSFYWIIGNQEWQNWLRFFYKYQKAKDIDIKINDDKKQGNSNETNIKAFRIIGNDSKPI